MTEPDVLSPKQANGCGLVLAALVVLAVAAYLLCGCASYTVVAADREVVPVYQNGTQDNRKTYIEAVEDATGWYVPDAVMLELLGAE